MPNPVDFHVVEKLREHMLLTAADMAALFGVSRITYYGWRKGKPLRKSNAEKVRSVLQQLAAIIRGGKWPTPEARAAEPKQRREMVLALLSA